MPDAGSGRGDNHDVLLDLVAYLLPADPLREHRRAEAASAGVGEDGNAEIKVEILLSLYGDCTKERLKSTHCGHSLASAAMPGRGG
jgi:hypothetical protein